MYARLVWEGKCPDGLQFEEAEEAIRWYKNLFGDDYYLELQRHKATVARANHEVYPMQQVVNEKLIEYANGRVSLMAGCGVNENNIRQLALESGATEFHFSAREKIESAMRYSNPEVKMGSDSINEYTREITTAQRVRRTIEALNI